MGKLKLYIASSLDGKIARADHSLDWLPEPENNGKEEDYGYYEFYNPVGSLVMGYKTYEIAESFGDWPYKGKTSYIFSRDADKKVIADAQLITEDPVSFTSKLKKQEEKDIWLVGGGVINTLLHNAGLIDEYIITVIPVILGKGIELFPDIDKEQKLSLVNTKTYSDGLVSLHYINNEAN